MQEIVSLDRSLILLLNGSGQTWADGFWTGYTSLWPWWPCVLVMAVVLWNACEGGWKRRLLVMLALIALVTVLDQTSSTLLKPFFCRLRPSHDPAVEHLLHYVGGYRGGNYGFPSGHATNCAGIATWLCLSFRNVIARCCFVLFASACATRAFIWACTIPATYWWDPCWASSSLPPASSFCPVMCGCRPTGAPRGCSCPCC